MTYSSSVLSLTPTAYWRMGEASGTLDNAEGTSTYDATTFNTPTYSATGLLTNDADTAISFASASSEYAQTNGALPAIGADFSLTAWIKPTTVIDTIFLSQASVAFLRVLANGSVVFRWTDASAVTRDLTSSAGEIVAGNTYFLVGLYDGTTARIYKNGSQIASDNTHTGGTVGSAAWSIARHPTALLYFNGVLDEIAIFDSALSPSNVTTLWNAGIDNESTGIPVLLLGGL